MREGSGCRAVSGFLLILAGPAFNPWVAKLLFGVDSIVTHPSIILLIIVCGVLLTALGAILLFTSKLAFTRHAFVAVLTRSVLLLLSLWLANLVLYLASPYLPLSVVSWLSAESRLARYVKDESISDWRHLDNIRVAKPGASILTAEGTEYVADSFGYNNPPGYIDANPDPDVVLVGDSFIWGNGARQTIADHLRRLLAPLTVYSIGMGGEGIPQWRFHYERLISSHGASPHLVVLNFTAYNDINDTKKFQRLRGDGGVVHAAAYIVGVQNAPGLLDFLMMRELFGLAHWVKRHVDAVLLGHSRHLSPLRGAPEGTLVGVRREPDAEALDDSVLEEIHAAVAAVRAVTPDANIALSYIPSPAAVYGDRLEACATCDDDAGRQLELSSRLETYSSELSVQYVDVTADLGRLAPEQVLWGREGHFSEQGYRAYSQSLADSVRGVITAGVP